MDRPETHYTSMGDVSIAYQVFGEGPDLLSVPMFMSHVDLMWSEPRVARFLRHMAGMYRVIQFDMPGTGLSDRVSRAPTLEERADVIETVLDAAGSRTAALFGTSEGAQASLLFAATRPERTSALILYAPYPKLATRVEIHEMLADIYGSPDPAAADQLADRMEATIREMDAMVEHWGEGRSLDLVMPPPHIWVERQFWAMFERAAASPSAARIAMQALRAHDVTSILPSVQAPTLIVHPVGDHVVPVEAGRMLAKHIPNARIIEPSGVHHGYFLGDILTLGMEVERFLSGTSHPYDPLRGFTTVLFTDIVGSTDLAAELGDLKWRQVLENHDGVVRQVVQNHGGSVVKGTGDGFLVTFDRPTPAIECALEIAAGTAQMGFSIRAGVHCGECEVLREDLAGLAVHVAARIMALAEPGEVLVSGAVRDLVGGSELQLEPRGLYELKGVPEPYMIFAVDGTGTDGHLGLLPVDRERLGFGDQLGVAFASRLPGAVRGAARLWRGDWSRAAESKEEAS